MNPLLYGNMTSFCQVHFLNQLRNPQRDCLMLTLAKMRRTSLSPIIFGQEKPPFCQAVWGNAALRTTFAAALKFLPQ